MSLVNTFKPQFGITLLIFFLVAKIQDLEIAIVIQSTRQNYSYGLSFFSRGLVKLFESNTQLFSKNNLQPTKIIV